VVALTTAATAVHLVQRACIQANAVVAAAVADTAGAESRLPAISWRSPIVTVLCIDVHDDALPLRLGRWPGSSTYERS